MRYDDSVEIVEKVWDYNHFLQNGQVKHASFGNYWQMTILIFFYSKIYPDKFVNHSNIATCNTEAWKNSNTSTQ